MFIQAEKNIDFVYYMLTKFDIKQLSFGTGQPLVKASELKNLDLKMPTQIVEQQKIGLFFSHLDILITLHQRECFSFDFSGESAKTAQKTISWEQRKVGELTVESSEYTTLEAGFPLLTSSRNGLMYQNEYRGKQTTDSTETMFSIVPLGACTYRHMSDDDVFHLNVNRLEKGLVSREYPVFYASDDNNLDFIVQQINSSAEFRSFCAEQKKGGTRTRLYYKNLCEFQMLIPNTEEQEKIATFLLTLDTLAEPIDDHIGVTVPGGAGEEVCLGSLLALTLRAVAGNGELAEAVLANGLDFRIGSHSASYQEFV